MIGKTILHFTPWDRTVRFFGLFCQEAKTTDMRVDSSLLSHGVNTITEKLGEGGSPREITRFQYAGRSGFENIGLLRNYAQIIYLTGQVGVVYTP